MIQVLQILKCKLTAAAGPKVSKNVLTAVPAMLGCVFLIAGLAIWPHIGNFQRIVFILEAIFAVWICRWAIALTDAIISIAKRLREENLPRIKQGKNSVVNELAKAINEQFSINSRSITVLEKQSQDLQIQIQLSQREKSNTAAIIYGIRDAVVVIDESDRILMANEAAGKIFDFDFKNSQHRPIEDLIGQKQKEFVEFLRHSRKSKVQATKREIEIAYGDKQRIFDCIVSSVSDEKENICGAVAVLHDITHEREVSKMKTDFVSHVSHELKTPLASITAYSELLIDGEADDEKTRKEFYSVIQSQAKRLNRLIEDILNIARIESGMMKLKKQPASLTILLEEQLQMIKGYAEEKSIEVTAQKAIVFDQVYVDKDMISQVLVNLLSNAVKYTPAKGKIKIETEVNEAAGMARLSVTDTGVGIPEDKIKHVFDKFYRVGENKKQANGTGLGLNLVKQIIETVHKGRVFVKSEQGEGSTFGFELPLATKDQVQSCDHSDTRKTFVEAK